MTTADTIRLDQLDSRIRSVWLRGQVLHLIAGALAVVRWAVPLFLVGMFIDWMTYMPVVGRVVILVTLIGVALWRGWSCGWRSLRPFDAVHTALQLEAKQGDLKSLLVSAIQLRGQANTGAQSSALSQHTCRLAEAAAADVRPQQAVPFKPLQRPAVIVIALVVLVALFATVNGPFLAAGLTRIFSPWLFAEYPTNTQIALSQDALIIKEGDAASITAQLSGIIPDSAVIEVKTGDSRARAIDLEVIGDACTYEIASASRDFTYRIKAGDDRTPWLDVRVVAAPRIEHVQVELAYPEYLQREATTVEALTLTAPEGTGLNWTLKLDKPIKAAAFVRDGQPPVDLTVASDGRSIAFSQDVTASQGYHFEWVDQAHGYRFTSPRYFLQIAADQPPRVELTKPESNLVAMLGRPMKLAARVQDDHGIESARIVYRVNQFDEKTLDLPNALQSGQGEQAIDWDYRQTLTDLQVGDSVSFVVEVRDRYPGGQGAHAVRSETRRISFLSKEQYLEQIEKQRDRLLSRVQTLYRQQRAAHEAVRDLSPEDQGYQQACQLESIRQAMVRDQLHEIAGQIQALLDDLAANNVSDPALINDIASVRTALIRIADDHVANASSHLRDASSASLEGGSSARPVRATNAVNAAARELGSLVLRRGIESAQEVYAREARMLAQEQIDLRWLSLNETNADRTRTLAAHQADVAAWTQALITDLQAGMRYDKRPLAVLRLVRSVKDLDASGAVVQMRQASEMIGHGQGPQAAAIQADLTRTLLDAEFSVRLSGAYSTLLRSRDMLGSIMALQASLRSKAAELSASEFDAQRAEMIEVQAALRKQLLTLLLPTAPAPRAGLFDETLPQPPPIDTLLSQADSAMVQALSQLQSDDPQSAANHQTQAGQVLAELYTAIDRWSVDLGLQSQGLSTLVAASSDRMSRLEDFEARTIALLEKTDLAAADEKKVDTLAESQLNLADDLAGYIQSLARADQAEPDEDLPPLMSRLRSAEKALNAAVQTLQENDADAAIGHQEQAADALAEAYAIVVAQNERLSLLQSLLMFQRSVGFANGYMADIVAEQRDLLKATEAAKPEAMATLLPPFAHMRQCMEDVAPLLDLIAGRLDVGTPLVFAKTDFEDAMVALESGDQFEAIDAQDVAAQSLAQVQGLVQEIQFQTGYVAEIVNFLHQSVSDAGTIAYEQHELRDALLAVEQQDLQRYVDAQALLLAKAKQIDRQRVDAAGSPALVPVYDPLVDPLVPTKPVPIFSEPSEMMQEALDALKANDAPAAADAMELAVAIDANNAQAMLKVIEMLQGLPSVEVLSSSPPELVRLVDVLALASKHKRLFRQTQAADDKVLAAIASQQRSIATSLNELATNGQSHPLLSTANQSLADALAAFDAADRQSIAKAQRQADAHLRHFIIEQSLILDTAIPPAAASDLPSDNSPDSDEESALSAGFIADFVSGETPGDKRTQWQVLAERNRAALNQNFARELPLEYRGLLKDYYERVAK